MVISRPPTHEISRLPLHMKYHDPLHMKYHDPLHIWDPHMAVGTFKIALLFSFFFFCLFVISRPTREIFTHMEMSTLRMFVTHGH